MANQVRRLYWRITRVALEYRPYRPLWMWWRISRSKRVWAFRWQASALQYQLRSYTPEQVEEAIQAAFAVIKEERAPAIPSKKKRQ